MKKILLSFISVFMLGVSVKAQTKTPSTNPVDVKEENFDKKFRFGIRATPQPTWYKSDNINSSPNGANFGFGFGMIMEIKLSKLIHFSTGIGGDFEGGRIKYRHEDEFSVNAVLNSEGVYVESKDGKFDPTVQLANGNTQVVLKDRKYNSTMITLPFILKMMTEEYSGARYFAMFGGELAIRAGAKATDTYYNAVKSTVSGTTTTSTILIDASDLTKSNINIGKDASLLPFRVGMNLGLGTEYRIGGSTSFLFSVNYFQSFTNLMRNDSKYLVKAAGPTTAITYNQLNQGYLMRAVRINIGLLF